MAEQVFEKWMELDSLPREWGLVKVAVDWSGHPILLMVEGRGPSPGPEADHDEWSRWKRTPRAFHIVFLKGKTVSSIRITQGIGQFAAHIQPYDGGWILGYARTGRANVYDGSGALMRTLSLGDAIEDLQTLPDGNIWVSYFDEGVFGEGISTQGLVCFDRSGKPVFRYRDDSALNRLPPIDDCYALNVAMNGDVWINYYSDFPLVLIRDLKIKQDWREFGSVGSAFAVNGDRLIYLRDSKLMIRSLDAAGTPKEVRCVDADQNLLVPTPARDLKCAARDGSLVLNTGAAIYATEL
jgi:hypothetical protein